MSTAATVVTGGRTVSIRGTAYPVLLPTLRDPRLHLAAVIVSLQVLGQVAFAFDLSIAQILLSLGTCAVLEFAIAFGRQHVIMWPASALLTGNGVAFVLRVPGTQHGDWWSLNGWWIYVATAAVAILSKHVIRFRGRHVFNPSNIGLVLCFLILGKDRADPLDFWWAQMSFGLALALVIIVAGGLLILSRLKLLPIAIGFWLTFAAGIGVLALTDHYMLARWHLGPVTGAYFWWVLITSPEVLVFLFFMITDPKTIPDGRRAQRFYAVAVGLLAVLLIAPQTTEFAHKVALLGALTIVCAAHPFLTAFGVRRWAADRLRLLRGRRAFAVAAAIGIVVAVGAIASAGIPARLGATPVLQATNVSRLPAITVLPSRGVESKLDRATALRITRDLVADLEIQADALRRRDVKRAAAGASGAWLAGLRKRVSDAGGKAIGVPTYRIETAAVHLETGDGQGPPRAVAVLEGSAQLATYDPSALVAAHVARQSRFTQTFELTPDDHGRFLISGSRAASSSELVNPTVTVAAAGTQHPVSAATARAVAAGFAGVRLENVARQVGLDFRQGAFRFGVSVEDPQAMMGGGLCWLDYNNDGWLDLFVVNSYSDLNLPNWQRHGGLPRSALFRNDHGRFVNVSNASRAGIRVKGTGCVAADFNGDGYTDLYVSTATDDKLLWNNGNGTFTEGARSSGVVAFSWHSGAAVADVNGDGRPDLFVAGYTDVNAPTPGSSAGFPTSHLGIRDLLFLNEGNLPNGHARFREVGRKVGLDTRVEHGLGAVFSDVNGDGRPDLYVANDLDPNRLYLNVALPGGPKADPAGLGFRFVERGRAYDLADRNAGMGVAVADYSGDRRPDLFVSNSRSQEHAIFRSRPGRVPYGNDRRHFAAAFGSSFAGWGASWVDLNRDGNLDLVLANGDIPITNLRKDARPLQVLENLTGQGMVGQFADASKLPGLLDVPSMNGRGVAAADFNNDGNVDVAINSIGGPLVLLENKNTAGHWLEVSLAGFHPGAVLTVTLPDGRRLVREIQAGSSYLSSEDPRAFFGLGAATTVRSLVVRWPGGRVTRLAAVPGDRIVRIKP
jgi:hypothetical protein